MNTAFLKNSLVGLGLLTAGMAFAAGPALTSAIPANNSELDCIKSGSIVTYWSTEGVEYMFNWNNQVTVYNMDGLAVATGYLDASWDDATMFTLVFNNPSLEIVEEGRYVIDIPAESFEYEMAVTGEAAKIVYYVNGSLAGGGGGGEVVDAKYTFNYADPADGSTISPAALKLINTYWNVGDDFPGVNWEKTPKLLDASGNEVATGEMNFDWEDATLYPITFAYEAPNGDYTVVIPAGAIVDDTDTPSSAEVRLHYTVAGGDEPGPGPGPANTFVATSVYPTDGATINYNMGSELNRVNITYDQAGLALVNATTTVNMVRDNGEIYESDPIFVFALDPKNPTLIVSFETNPIKWSGTYTLEIPEGILKAGENVNAAQNFSWEYIQDRNLDQDLPPVDESEFTVNTCNITDEEGNVVLNFLEPGLSAAEIPAGVLNIGIDRDRCQAILYRIVDLTTTDIDEKVLYTAWTYIDEAEGIYTNGALGEDGCFHFNLQRNFTLFEDHEYQIELEAYWKFDGIPADQRIMRGFGQTPIFTGNTAGFKYSDVEILKVTPAAHSILDIDNRVVSITYSAPVEVLTGAVEGGSFGSSILTGTSHGMEGIVSFESVESNQDKTVWSFTLSKDEIATSQGEIILSVAADDMRGRRVRPSEDSMIDLDIRNNGQEDRTCQQFNMYCYEGCPSVVVEPGSSVVGSLYSFTFTAPEAANRNIGYQAINAEGEVLYGVLRSTSGAVVATLDGSDIDITWNDPNAEEAYSTALTMHLDKEVTEPGLYTLDIPACYFMTGTQYDGAPNKRLRVEYTVEGELSLDAASIKDGEVMSAVGLVAVYVGTEVVLAEDAKMQIRRNENDRRPAEAKLNLTNDGEFYRLYADFTDPDQGFAPYALDPRDEYNEGMGQDYQIVVPAGTVRTASGSEFAEKVINVHAPGANEVAGQAETVPFVTQLGSQVAVMSPVVKGQSVNVQLMPEEGWKLDEVLYNDEDVAANVEGGVYTTPAVDEFDTLYITFAFDGEVQVIDGYVGVTDIAGSEYKITVEGGRAVITGLNGGETVAVYSVGGMLIDSKEATADAMTVVLEQGTFIITIDGKHAVKVIL